LYNVDRESHNHHRLRAEATQVADTLSARRKIMNCTIQGCPGHYEQRPILHTVKQGEAVVVFEDVPAEVCNVCFDMLLAPGTVRHLERLFEEHPAPSRHAPVYTYTEA